MWAGEIQRNDSCTYIPWYVLLSSHKCLGMDWQMKNVLFYIPQGVTENKADRVTSWTQVCWMKGWVGRKLPCPAFFPLGGGSCLGGIYRLISAFGTAFCSEWCDFCGIFFFLFLSLAVTLWNIIFASSTAGLYNWWPLWVAGALHLNHARLGSSVSEFITFWKASRLFVFTCLLLWRGRWLWGRKRSAEQSSRSSNPLLSLDGYFWVTGLHVYLTWMFWTRGPGTRTFPCSMPEGLCHMQSWEVGGCGFANKVGNESVQLRY